MKTVQLRVEHRHQDRFLKQRHLRPGNKYFTVGSSRDADFRLLGEDVSGIHAIIEFRDDAWYVSDVASLKGTITGERKLNDVVEHKISGPMKFAIGGHTLDVQPCEVRRVLFQKEARDIDSASGDRLVQQVVIRQKGHVVETQFIPVDQSFELCYGIKSEVLAPPKTKQWVWHTFGSMTVQQRIVGMSRHVVTTHSGWDDLLPQDIRKSMGQAFVALLALLFIFTIPYIGGKNEETEIPKILNPYTQMVYDAKVVKRKVDKSEKITAAIMNRGQPKGPSPEASAAQEVVSPKKNLSNKNVSFDAAAAANSGQKAIKQIKAANLSALIGRLSKRTVSANLVKVSNTDNSRVAGGLPQNSGSLASITKNALGSIAVGAGNSNGTQKLGGVGTIGAGGASSYKQYGALTTGSVGTGNVGTLEEEADIEGGLDRDVISQYINGQIGHIRYCYERQLSAKPDLYGKIKVQFTIGSTGSVVQSKIGSSTLQDAIVEGCILKRVASWVFPTPKGGTTVLVSYPFLFKSTN